MWGIEAAPQDRRRIGTIERCEDGFYVSPGGPAADLIPAFILARIATSTKPWTPLRSRQGAPARSLSREPGCHLYAEPAQEAVRQLSGPSRSGLLSHNSDRWVVSVTITMTLLMVCDCCVQPQCLLPSRHEVMGQHCQLADEACAVAVSTGPLGANRGSIRRDGGHGNRPQLALSRECQVLL
jgi:hypothetical protein